MIWSSEYQILRARTCDHFFIDGTFDTVPFGFCQLLIVMAYHSITNAPQPFAFILLNRKLEILYRLAFRCFQKIIDGFWENNNTTC